MATRYYTGAAVLTKQVVTITPGGTIAATDTFSVTISGTTYTFTVGGTATAAAVATGLYTLIVAGQALEESPEWVEVTVVDSTGFITITANTAGKPFTVSTAINNVSGGAAPTLTAATITANSGPEQYDLAANWSSATLPVSTDTVIIEGYFNLRYGDLSAVTAAQLIVREFSGEIGLPPINADGGYPEYRAQSFLMSATAINVFSTNKSQLIRFDVSTNACTMNVYGTGSSRSDRIAALTWKGTNAANAINVLNGDVGICTEAGETGQIATLRVDDGTVETGIGLTNAKIIMQGGKVTANNDVSNIDTYDGELDLVDDADIGGQLSIYGGTVIVNGTSTIATLLIYKGGILDATQDVRAFTISAAEFFNGATIKDPTSRITWSPAVQLHCDVSDLTLQLGPARQLTIT